LGRARKGKTLKRGTEINENRDSPCQCKKKGKRAKGRPDFEWWRIIAQNRERKKWISG